MFLSFVSGSKLGIFEIKKGDFSVKVTNYGARIVSVILPDKNGAPIFRCFLEFMFNVSDF